MVSETSPPSFAFGRFEFDGPKGKLLLDGREIALPPRELQLLGLFLEHPAEWLTQEGLAHGLWPRAVPPTGELERLIRELTAALDAGADGVATIQSLKGRGHRFLLPVRASAPPGAQGTRPSPPARGRSAHRRLLGPRQIVLALLGVGALAAALLWVNRPAQWRSATGSTGADGAAARDPQALRAAATAEWQRGVVAARQPDLASRRLAVSRFEAALVLDPGLAAAHAGLAHTLVLEGLSVAGGGEEMERARRAAEAALAQLPLARTSTEVDPEVACDEGAILYLAGRSLEARRQLSEVVRREPLFRRAHAALAALHLRDRRLGAAAFELEMLDALAAGATRDDDRVRQRAAGSWAMPEASEAARLLAERAEGALRTPPGAASGAQLEAARIFAQFGDHERAIAALGRALDRRESAAALARIDPAFAALRPAAAFRELLARAGVPGLAQP